MVTYTRRQVLRANGLRTVLYKVTSNILQVVGCPAKNPSQASQDNCDNATCLQDISLPDKDPSTLNDDGEGCGNDYKTLEADDTEYSINEGEEYLMKGFSPLSVSSSLYSRSITDINEFRKSQSFYPVTRMSSN